MLVSVLPHSQPGASGLTPSQPLCSGFGGKQQRGAEALVGATGHGDIWVLCSIVWEKPALLGHRVTVMLKGHKLPVPLGLPGTAPLPCLTLGATEHPVICIPPLSRTSQHSVNLGVPKFPGRGAEPSAADSHAAAHCIPAAPSPPTPLHASLECTFPARGTDVPNFVPSGLQGLCRVLGSPGAARDPLVPPPAWSLLKMYGRPCAAG